MRNDMGQQAVLAQVDSFHVGRCGQHGDDHLDVAAGQFGDAGGGGGTGFDQAGDGALGEVGYGELMPCLEQVPGHRPAHVTQSYKANFHVVASLLLSGGWACCARRSRRGRRSYNVLGTATPLWEPCPWAGCSLGVLCTPFAAGALLLHPSVGALPVGGLFPVRALHAVRSGGAAPTPLCGSPARGRAVPWACFARRSQRGRCSYTPLWEPCPWAGCSLGVLCTPFAAGALLLHPSVGALPVGERAVPVGVLCTPFAAGALLLPPSVGALPVGERAVPWACFARRSQRGRCSYTPLWGPARGGKGRFPGRALHAVRSEGAAPTDLCGSPALGANGAQRAPAQLCLKFGWRFSTKACMPSVWSAVAKIEWNTRRSKRTPSARLVSNTRLTHSLVIITLGSDLLAMTWAVFRVSSSSWSTGKILATRPACSASRASIWRPVRHISMALALPMARVRRWVPPIPGSTPRLISGWPKRALSAA